MPVPEIDRLAHEILDILGSDLPYTQRPESTWTLRDSACVAIARKVSEVNAAREPLFRCLANALDTGDLSAKEATTVWKYAFGQFETRPSPALLCLYAALERAEMQERATPTPNLDADQEAAFPLRGRPDDDMSRHQDAEGTR